MGLLQCLRSLDYVIAFGPDRPAFPCKYDKVHAGFSRHRDDVAERVAQAIEDRQIFPMLAAQVDDEYSIGVEPRTAGPIEVR